jgi:hypothetical protein
MNRYMLRLLREMFPDMFPRSELSPEQKAKQAERGRGLARFKPWARGRIGGLEHRVHGALISAEFRKVSPVTTGWLVREVYLGIGGRAGKDAKISRWMYGNVRKAAETYAVRIGRGNGHGSPVLWKLKEGDAVYAAVIRKKKERAYARRKRKASESPAPSA